MRSAIIVTAIGLMLASCGPKPEEIAAAQHAQCLEFGYEVGTDEYGNCRIALMQLYEQRRAANASAFLGSQAAGASVRQGYFGY